MTKQCCEATALRCEAKHDALRDENQRLRAQLPVGMEHCTILFIECPHGHGRLIASNWTDTGCHWCRIAGAQEALGAKVSFSHSAGVNDGTK